MLSDKVVEKKIKRINPNICCEEYRRSIKLEGVVDSWEEVIQAGKLAAKSHYKGVINNITVNGLKIPKMTMPLVRDESLDGMAFDVVVIGGGVIGSAIIYALSKYDISVLLLEKESDLAMHQSSRNDSMVHPGLVPKPGSVKAKYNVKGNQMFENWAKNLGVSFNRTGSLILFDRSIYKIGTRMVQKRAEKNGLYGIEYLDRTQVMKKEPYISDQVAGGFFIPTTGVCPSYEFTIALAEQAVLNGADVSLETVVEGFEIEHKKIKKVKTNRGKIKGKVIINAAGLFSDAIAEMAGDRFFTIHPRKGQIALLDKKVGDQLQSILAIVNPKMLKSNTKGGGLVKTVDGNILVGPSAYEQPYKEDYSTNRENLDMVLNKNLPYIKGLNKSQVITYIAGTRAATYKEDFIVEVSEYVENLVHAAGIQSPGYASSPAIAEAIEERTIDLLKQIQPVQKIENWEAKRNKTPRLSELPFEQREKYIRQNKDYGKIICRCEEISKGEIIDAIKAPIPAMTVDAIKRRTRATMGRCQGGFCSPMITQIIAEELGIDLIDVEKKGHHSQILYRETKGGKINENL